MNEHESNLYDLYAGMAMMGILSAGHPTTYSGEIARTAHEMARAMIEERANAKDQATPAPDVAVPDVEGREDSDTKGITALKKARARHKAV